MAWTNDQIQYFEYHKSQGNTSLTYADIEKYPNLVFDPATKKVDLTPDIVATDRTNLPQVENSGDVSLVKVPATRDPTPAELKALAAKNPPPPGTRYDPESDTFISMETNSEPTVIDNSTAAPVSTSVEQLPPTSNDVPPPITTEAPVQEPQNVITEEPVENYDYATVDTGAQQSQPNEIQEINVNEDNTINGVDLTGEQIFPTQNEVISTDFGFNDDDPFFPSPVGEESITLDGGLGEFFSDPVGGITDGITGLGESITNVISDPLGSITDTVTGLGESITNVISDPLGSITDTIGDITDGIGDAVDDLLGGSDTGIPPIITNETNTPATAANETQDWRVRLSLAEKSEIFYKDPENAGILQPLLATKGIIFPYTPTISVQHTANYEAYDLTHSNYKGYFYKGSAVSTLALTATFTAQDTNEANYLLAVIHFLKSATKMFYGQDKKYRGSPPPVLFLHGLGEYQFANHPCVVSNMNYALPSDVDYIGAGQPIQTTPKPVKAPQPKGYPKSTSARRLGGSGVGQGGVPLPPTIKAVEGPYTELTYVPTKIDINFQLLPVQTRTQVSKEFSLEEYASGTLLKGGFW